ncbi:MAG: DUF362 domain-containing protein [Candidatus Liptonbacteria bacterium]|nr:DUF362 domain-containing protein [Candidatus Liptonbacteria bacterium]
MSRVVVRSTKNEGVEGAVRSILEKLNWKEIVKPSARVVIKLNLCEFDAKKVCNANTDPKVIYALVGKLKGQTKNITLVEAHSYRAPAEAAFKSTKIYELADKLGVKVVNLSKSQARDVGNKLLGPMPEIVLDADVFITMPKLKTHALTYFTGSLKNQWGCVPRHDRIALHHSLDSLIVDINGLLKPKLCIMDGIIGMDDRGPTNGRPRSLDIILGSTDPVALDATAMRLVGLDPNKAKHVTLAYAAKQGSFKEEEIELDMDFMRDWADFKPAHLDWAIRTMNHMTRYRWFRDYVLSVNWIFYPTKLLVNILRKMGIVR